jgi:membrane dipeptidase
MPVAPTPEKSSAEAALLQYARSIHENVITIDTHVDFVSTDLVGAPNYTERMNTQFNLPKMSEGGLDALFFVVYVAQAREIHHPDAFTAKGYDRAFAAAIEKFDAVHRFVREIAPETMALALTADGVRRIHCQGKKVALLGVENGYPIGEDVGRVEEFYRRGARYLSLTHNGHNQLGDSHTGEREGWKWRGLSPLGRQAIAEMNRLGIMVDISHASKEAMMQSAALTKAPLIASHSAARALCNVSRNLDDEQLLAVKNTGGTVQIVAYGGFLKVPTPDTPERIGALASLRREFNLPDLAVPQQRASFHGALNRMAPDRRAEYDEKLAAIDGRYPADAAATVKDFVDHIDYAVNFLGIDHVGIASDFDGGGGVTGWNDASETFNVTLELTRRGYTESQIEKLWGGNLLRVLDDVQRLAREQR